MPLDELPPSTVSLVHVPDWPERCVRMLPSKLRDLPRWRALAMGIGAAGQVVEDLGFAILADSTLWTSTGYRLKQIGRIVGEEIGALTEQEYRRVIAGRILVNRCDGTIDELLNLYGTLMAPASVRYFSYGLGGFELQATRSEFVRDVFARRVARMMADAAPGGKAMALIEASDGYFGFEGDASALGFDVGLFARRID